MRKHGDSTKYLARVLAVAHECDLALLTGALLTSVDSALLSSAFAAVDSEKFWEGLAALEFGTVPMLQGSRTVSRA